MGPDEGLRPLTDATDECSTSAPLHLQCRGSTLPHLEELIVSSDALSAFKRGELRDRIADTPRLNPYLRITPASKLRNDHTRIKIGDTLLVVENSDIYATLLRLLRPAPGAIGHIAFGSGHAFEASVATITQLPRIRQILYYGDLDAEGLSIPARASATAVHHGLPWPNPLPSSTDSSRQNKPAKHQRSTLNEPAYSHHGWISQNRTKPALS
ncbi:Wadjet anti-phage system protein JetD domain-containing protein [Allosalinactinospora lopnorensis]|uniref:Wadjet anti-phage system protein JetD domain-containing protein n=1 Tax=Allosalinactinospora lopnorensis TaxID=1352348 RepID=UPI000623F6DF|nr:Wadjet anti-phage system protein JetD domain-containing protein [Allosalinactinospora lopnorensis]